MDRFDRAIHDAIREGLRRVGPCSFPHGTSPSLFVMRGALRRGVKGPSCSLEAERWYCNDGNSTFVRPWRKQSRMHVGTTYVCVPRTGVPLASSRVTWRAPKQIHPRARCACRSRRVVRPRHRHVRPIASFPPALASWLGGGPVTLAPPPVARIVSYAQVSSTSSSSGTCCVSFFVLLRSTCPSSTASRRRRRTLVVRFFRLSSAWSTTNVCTCDKTRWMVGSSWRRAQA